MHAFWGRIGNRVFCLRTVMPSYPKPDNVEIHPQARTFILFALTLAYPMFGAGFELGAYGELIYERKITAWAVVTAVWLGFGLVPREQTGIKNWQLLALAVPCLWLLAAGFFSASGADPITRPLMFTLGLVSYLLCFPFAVYLAVKVVNPDLLNLYGWKPKSLGNRYTVPGISAATIEAKSFTFPGFVDACPYGASRAYPCAHRRRHQ